MNTIKKGVNPFISGLLIGVIIGIISILFGIFLLWINNKIFGVS